MKRYNLKAIMQKAWKIFRVAAKKAAITFSEALKLAWTWGKVQEANKAIVEAAAQAAGYGDMVCRTWYGWKTVGREVMHTEKAAFQVELSDPTTKKGSRIESYFTYEQTFEPMVA